MRARTKRREIGLDRIRGDGAGGDRLEQVARLFQRAFARIDENTGPGKTVGIGFAHIGPEGADQVDVGTRTQHGARNQRCRCQRRGRHDIGRRQPFRNASRPARAGYPCSRAARRGGCGFRSVPAPDEDLLQSEGRCIGFDNRRIERARCRSRARSRDQRRASRDAARTDAAAIRRRVSAAPSISATGRSDARSSSTWSRPDRGRACGSTVTTFVPIRSPRFHAGMRRAATRRPYRRRAASGARYAPEAKARRSAAISAGIGVARATAAASYQGTVAAASLMRPGF